MILATVGTHAQPFERFFAIVEAAQELGHEVVVQHGTTPPPRGVAHAVAFIPYEELVAYANEAQAVITHGGVGSILTASRAGHVRSWWRACAATASTSTITRPS